MRFLILAALTLLLGCAGAGQPARAGEAARGPALWKVADEDTTIYLFGTVHMLPEGFKWQNAVINKAFDASDTLVLEVLGTDDTNLTQPLIAELGISPGQPPLRERIPEEARDEFDAAIREAGIPAAMLTPMETWMGTMTISTLRIIKLGYDPDSGVEPILSARARRGQKIEALETMRQQLGFFDTLPEAEQRKLLVASLDSRAEIEKLITTTVNDWAAGDVEKVAAALEADVKSSPMVAKRLLNDRNANWAEWIKTRLDTQPGTVFLAVGTGHLAGKHSVQKMLKARGLKAERIN